jgi:hypothetical protein
MTMVISLAPQNHPAAHPRAEKLTTIWPAL